MRADPPTINCYNILVWPIARRTSLPFLPISRACSSEVVQDARAINLRSAGDGGTTRGPGGSRNLASHHQKSFALFSVAGCIESWMFHSCSSWSVRTTCASRAMPSASMSSSSHAKHILDRVSRRREPGFCSDPCPKHSSSHQDGVEGVPRLH